MFQTLQHVQMLNLMLFELHLDAITNLTSALVFFLCEYRKSINWLVLFLHHTGQFRKCMLCHNTDKEKEYRIPVWYGHCFLSYDGEPIPAGI
jgi:hypothetical protein